MCKLSPEICARLLEDCPIAGFPQRWEFLESDADSRILPPDLRPVVRALRQEVATDDLLESGVAVRSGRAIIPNPILTTDDRIVTALRGAAGPYNMMTSAGALHGLPFFEVQQDPTTQQMLDATGRDRLFVASMEDVVILRSLGFPAVPPAGLEGLSAAGMRELLSVVGGTSRGPIPAKPAEHPELRIDYSHRLGPRENGEADFTVVLVGCSVAEISPSVPQGILAAARYLASAQRFLQVHWDQLFFWWPSDDDLANLAYRSALRDREVVRDFFRHIESLYRVEDFADPANPPRRTASFFDVFQRLVQSQRQLQKTPDIDHYRKKYCKATNDYQEQIDRNLFQPLLDTALESKNLTVRALRLHLAHELRLLHSAFPSIHVAQASQLDSAAAAVTPSLPLESWRQMESLTNNIVKLVREETRIRKRRSRR